MRNLDAELLGRCKKNVRHAAALCRTHGLVLDMERGVLHHEQAYCAQCDFSKCDPLHTHQYGAREASRWDGKYIYYCPLGLVFCAASIHSQNGVPKGALIVGPILMGNFEDALVAIPEEYHREAQQLPPLSTEDISHLSELLRACAGFCAAPSSPWAGYIYNQEELQKSIYEARERSAHGEDEFALQLEYEKKLASLIAIQDKPGAQALLNELLGHMYFAARYDLELMKARALELLVVITRAAAEAGGDAKELYFYTPESLEELLKITSFDELCIKLGIMLHRFISCAFELRQAHHCDAVFKTMDFIRKNSHKRITLDDIAKNVVLSRSYISTIFKEETGQSLVSFINTQRVEHAKNLLRDKSISLVDIAGMCGFENQSYFSQVFKKITGTTPKRYRDSRGKLPENP